MPYVVINDNEPEFSESDYSETSYEYYSDLDGLGRCGVAISNIGKDLMPTKKRGSIGQVKPSGWHTVKYDFVDGKYLYNRCHLIGYQLTAENANEKNLITGTRYMNVEGMLPFENMVADYIKETGNHVLYRVTPIYTGDNLVADGVEMEARSVEDDGEGISYHVFVYNEQPGVVIDHATGESHLAEDAEVYTSQEENADSNEGNAGGVQTEAVPEQMQEQAVQQHMQIPPPQRRRFPAVAFQRFPNREIHGLPINGEARFGSKPPSQAVKGRIQIGEQIAQFRPAGLQNPQTQFRLLFVLYHGNRPLPQRSKLRS